jgi:MFS family permease
MPIDASTQIAKSISDIRKYRIAASVFFFIAGLTFSTWASRIPNIQNKLHLSDAGLGGVLFALPAGLMVSLPLSGWLVSRFGSRKMMITGALMYPMILILLASSVSVIQLSLALFLFGLAGNLVNIAMNTQAVGVEAMYGRSVMASFHGLWSLAGFTGALTGTFFVSQGTATLTHFAIVCSLALLLVFFTYKHTIPHDPVNKQKQKIFVLPDKKIMTLGLIAFCSMLCEGAMADWSGVYFKKIVEAPASMITLGYVAFTGMMALGRFTGDWLVTKFGVTRMLQFSGVMITGGLFISVFFPFLITATIGFLMVGFGVSSVVPIAYGLAGKSTTMPASTALAAVSSISFLGFLIGPPIIGFIAQLISLRWAFLLIGILGFGTALLAGRLKKHKEVSKKNPEEPLKTIHINKANQALTQPIKLSGYVAWPDKLNKQDQRSFSGRTNSGGYVSLPRMNP